MVLNDKNKLKIGVLIDQLLPGGVQISAIEEVRELNKLGFKAELIVLMRKKYSFQYLYLLKNAPYRFLSDSFPWPFKVTFKFPVFSFFSTLHILSFFFVKKAIKQKEFDLLIAHSTAVSLAVFSLKLPYFAVIHDPLSYILKKVYSNTLLKYLFPILIPLSLALEKKFVQKAKAVIVDSPVHQPFVKKYYGISSQIIPHGSDVLNRLPSERGSAILAFSRWQKEKNPLFLLKIIKALPQAKLIIAGVWTNKNDLLQFKQKVKQLNITNQVTIITQFTNRKLTLLCRQSCLWIHPHKEAFGLAGLQAAAHGLPIIMPAHSGLATLFKDGQEGFFPKKISFSSFLKPVKKLLDNQSLAKKMGKKAWLRVGKKYSWLIHASRLSQLCQQVLLNKKVPHITVLEIGHAGGTGLSGGDKLFEEMTKRFTFKTNLAIVTSKYGSNHWRKSGLNTKLLILKPNFWENNGQPIGIFLCYLTRIIQATILLIRKQKNIQYLYSSTNIITDVLPAFILKLIRPDFIWFGRVHHLIPSPLKREGLFIVNLVSYLMQKLSLICLKNKADLIFCLNLNLLATLENQGFSKDKLAVLEGGIDFPKISQYQPQSNPGFEAVYLGRLHIVKGVFDCLSIWKEVVQNNPYYRLAIIGAGPKSILTKLRQRIGELQMENNIKILGYLKEKQIYDYLKTAKVFLFTDHEAGFSMAIAEAMAAGLPIVGYDIGILDSVYHQGFIKIPFKQTSSFSQKIVLLLRNPKLRKKISLQALKEAQKFDWQITSQKFIKYLNQLF